MAAVLGDGRDDADCGGCGVSVVGSSGVGDGCGVAGSGGGACVEAGSGCVGGSSCGIATRERWCWRRLCCGRE